ncbi:MerR family transcriptional regulator [Curtobacterium sp. MCLR17_054]|uniref:MerR family transcriptional regulator n=1 Tax=Curtobacterium sp. MCLR17_054 TaxID=2175632 RepID=UPI000DA98DCC|nr:MerR family transcriptional regulator [Curtobacterium sp. MCLR17_054]WIE66727.1 MerR family transcriptional regulator [Curtobacterium sp. MCLR17_054]
MRIGAAARRVGVEVHVLRHWHDTGVVVPDRAPSGHREYSEEHVRRLQVVRACQGVGMSLAEIRLVLRRSAPDRSGVITERLRQIRAQRDQLADAERFLEHVIDCTHDLLTRCPSCSAYASSGTRLRSAPSAPVPLRP